MATGTYDVNKLTTLGALKMLAERIAMMLDDADYQSGKQVQDALAAFKETLQVSQVFSDKKTSLDTADSTIIENYFKAHTSVKPNVGDVFVITTEDGTVYENSAYIYDDDEWQAITGMVDANKVIMREDIQMAGNYTQVGNKTKGQTATVTFATKGKSVANVLKDIFTARLSPTVTQPAVTVSTVTGTKSDGTTVNAGKVEAGTKLTKVVISSASMSAGSYTYGPATEVTPSQWQLDRITPAGNVLQDYAPDSTGKMCSVTDTNGSVGYFIIGDKGGTNVTASLQYKATASYLASKHYAVDNLGDTTSSRIEAGSKSGNSTAFTPFRNYFAGCYIATAFNEDRTPKRPELNSDHIRTDFTAMGAYAAGTKTLTIPAGTGRVLIACPATNKGVTKIVNNTTGQQEITGEFVKSSKPVEGAEGYTAIDYNVWTYDPDKVFESAAEFAITLG